MRMVTTCRRTDQDFKAGMYFSFELDEVNIADTGKVAITAVTTGVCLSSGNLALFGCLAWTRTI